MRRHTPAPLALLAALTVSTPWAARPAAAQEHGHHAAAADSGRPGGLSRVVDRGDELLFEYGPVSLPARATHDDVRQPPTLLFALPTDGWMRGYAVELVDSAGRRVSQRVLHHMNLVERGRRDLFTHAMARIAAAGAETSPVVLPRVVGLRGAKGDTLAMTLMFHNPTDTSWSGVTLRVRVPFTRASSRVGAVSVYPLSLAIGPKDRPNTFDLPPGKSEHFWEGSPSVEGRILGLSGHLHRYGVALRLEDRTEGKVLWEVRPQRDSAGEVLAMPVSRFVWSGGKRVRPDHVYRLTAVYDNPEGRTIPDGGMGVLGGLMMLARGKQWPAMDRQHPDYLADARALFGDPAAGHQHGGAGKER
jgi:hypothetical protein